jgi:hypothetical protein
VFDPQCAAESVLEGQCELAPLVGGDDYWHAVLYLAIQPCVKTAAQDFAEISDNRRTSNYLVFLLMTVN